MGIPQNMIITIYGDLDIVTAVSSVDF